jgi:hypothetical protein
MLGTMILTFLFKNEILASLSSTREDIIDSFTDLVNKKIISLVLKNSIQHRILKEKLKNDTKLVETIEWDDLWKVSTLGKILKGNHALIYAEGRLVEIRKNNHHFPLHLSERRRYLKLSSFIMKKDIDFGIETKINKM